MGGSLGRLGAYNYFRNYDPQMGRYLESDPLLQPNRLLGHELAFYVPIFLQTPTQLQPYMYVRSQPVGDSDRIGFGIIDFIHCIWLDRKVQNYGKQCRGECPNNMEGQIRFMHQYGSPSLSGALLHCTCAKAEAAADGELCAAWVSTCIAAGLPEEGPE
jgi:hypothetical protein